VVTADLVACFRRVLERTEAVQGELDRLDAVAGDGDHGVTMVLGWRAVCAALERTRPDFPGDALRVAAEAFADVGGSAGPLWGTALLRAARAVDDAPELDLDAVARAAAAAVQGMKDRGRCEEGDRTVVDAMAPAAAALAQAARDGLTLPDALSLAAEAADAGAAGTTDLVPRRGRASRAPDRVRGHEDPGARAAAVFWATQ
jgi:dihydroxyacetone kinase-like protein